MAAANPVGDKIPILAIGKAQKLHCFKNVKFLPCQYQHQKKKETEWVQELDLIFSSERWLVIDHCHAHPQIENLKSIKLFLLPLNTTSTTQPMDQGVIRSLTAKYRKNMAQKIIRSLEKDNALPEVLILKAMQMLVSAWNAVSTETIVNCFRKARISTANQESAIADKDYPLKDMRLRNEIDALRNIQPVQTDSLKIERNIDKHFTKKQTMIKGN